MTDVLDKPKLVGWEQLTDKEVSVILDAFKIWNANMFHDRSVDDGICKMTGCNNCILTKIHLDFVSRNRNDVCSLLLQNKIEVDEFEELMIFEKERRANANE